MDPITDQYAKFAIKYHKTKNLEPEPALLGDIDSVQQYNPVLGDLFELSETNYNQICLNHKYLVKNLDEVVDLETKEVHRRPVFVKYSPLLDPVRYMIGKYEADIDKLKNLPTVVNGDSTHAKMALANNASYVDSFFSFLTSQLLNHHNFKNGIDYYGSFLGIQEDFRMNIEDDLEYLNNSNFFVEHIGKRFTIENFEPRTDYANFGSRGNKNKLQLNVLEDNGESNVDLLSDILVDTAETEDTEDTIESPTPVTDLEMVYEKSKKIQILSNASYNSESTGSSNNSEVNYSSEGEGNEEGEDEDDEDDEDDWETDSNESGTEDGEEEEEEQVIAHINNFPVQMICLEKCTGTLDELFVQGIVDPEIGASALFQVIMSLLLYQKAFQFTHNDLHTNNVMFINTDQEFLEYCYNNKYYRVPTYGRIFKIIDFGRGIYKFAGKQFCSDSFAPGGDASTQYNFEPFFNRRKPRLEPNYAFDLCRLGCSIYDFIIEEGMPVKEMDDFQRTINRWCLDDNGKNVLYKSNGEERYPNFKLYKMIARTTHEHTPEAQLNFPFFSQFETADVLDGCMNIDRIPVYSGR